jgi:hypothetical protein
VVLPNGTLQHFGPDAASFHVTLKNARALRAVTSLDEGRFGDAYLAGDIDLEGDMLSPFQLRGSMKDFHLLTYAWRFIQPLIFGQVHTNRQAITAHYDIDPDFFLSFLDPKTPATPRASMNRRTRLSTSRPCASSTIASRNWS